MKKGLCIRRFMDKVCVCDGKVLEGKENDGELYIGTVIKWFDSFDEAEAFRKLIDDAYGFQRE